MWHWAANKSCISSSVALKTEGSFDAMFASKPKICQHPNPIAIIHPRTRVISLVLVGVEFEVKRDTYRKASG